MEVEDIKALVRDVIREEISINIVSPDMWSSSFTIQFMMGDEVVAEDYIYACDVIAVAERGNP